MVDEIIIFSDSNKNVQYTIINILIGKALTKYVFPNSLHYITT